LRVGIDDLAIHVRGKLQRDFAFAYGRGAKDNDEFRLHEKLEARCLRFKVQGSTFKVKYSEPRTDDFEH